jgi:hypothetical protein
MIVLEGIEQHRFIDFLMERLQEASPENELFDAKFRVVVKRRIPSGEGRGRALSGARRFGRRI